MVTPINALDGVKSCTRVEILYRYYNRRTSFSVWSAHVLKVNRLYPYGLKPITVSIKRVKILY